MLTILIVVLLILLFLAGGYRRYRYERGRFDNVLSVVLVIILILWLARHVHV
jgi:hypothetical protein